MDDGSTGNRLVISYLSLRRSLGLLGVMLPPVLVAGVNLLGDGGGIEGSISAYYDTAMGDVLVGVLFAIAVFLFAYTGYERVDDVAGDLACVFALGVALFPVSGDGAVPVVHYLSATGLFLTLAFFALFLFTKSSGDPTPEKQIRNRIYVACGTVMLVCVGAIAAYSAFLQDTAVAGLSPVFWLESLALWAFGFSWLVKGEALLQDG